MFLFFFFRQVLPVVASENLLISCIFDRNTKQEIAVIQASYTCRQLAVLSFFINDVDDRVKGIY